jgi:D-sedoheptulose 7-phosphate isomerase
MKTMSGTLPLAVERTRESIQVKQAILENDHLLEDLQELAGACIRALEAGGKLVFFGNGGSAADAQHLVAELTGRYLREGKALAAIALTTNTSSLTAIENDYCYDEVFSRQIEAIGNKGDVAIGISTSGNSENVIRAMKIAKQKELITAGMTGRNGGKLSEHCAYCLNMPSEHTPRIQEAHILLGHILCEIIEQKFPNDRNIS